MHLSAVMVIALELIDKSTSQWNRNSSIHTFSTSNICLIAAADTFHFTHRLGKVHNMHHILASEVEATQQLPDCWMLF